MKNKKFISALAAETAETNILNSIMLPGHPPALSCNGMVNSEC